MPKHFYEDVSDISNNKGKKETSSFMNVNVLLKSPLLNSNMKLKS